MTAATATRRPTLMNRIVSVASEVQQQIPRLQAGIAFAGAKFLGLWGAYSPQYAGYRSTNQWLGSVPATKSSSSDASSEKLPRLDPGELLVKRSLKEKYAQLLCCRF